MIDILFSSIKLSNGDKCDVYEAKVIHIWKATFNQKFRNPYELDFTPFLLEQIMKINNENVSIDRLGELCIDDYLAIAQIIEASQKKINL